MKASPEKIWPAVAAISAAAAAISAFIAAFSLTEGNILQAALSGIAAAMFVSCLLLALMTGSRLSSLNSVEEEISCFRLKRPGIEKKEEIIPKGKMPKE
ncbi:MAG: hypothetical protein LBR42_03050 [Candidatus Methanoplasma sp.]|jgi:zinc transporter ZupT|nr:hypothetical protein [Candidatus Methanoplasma sp.]